MTKRLLFLIVFFLMFSLFISVPNAYAFDVNATAAILIDADTGKILFQKNPHEKHYPASTTKVLTALIALGKGDLTQKITVPDNFVNAGEAGIWLEPGETQTLEDMLYALLLRSANDAAQLIAIGIAGSQEAFVQMMNEKTVAMGLVDSHWTNPHGLHDKDHYTSVYDMAYIARVALQNSVFNQIIVTHERQLPWGDNEYNRVVYNRNQFLSYYPYADGIKTGYTTEAGSCLVASATKDGMRLIGVVFDCNGMYDQMADLMDYGFNNFERKKIASAGDTFGQAQISGAKIDSVDAVLKEDVYVVLPKDTKDLPIAQVLLQDKLNAPVTQADAVGSVTYKDTQGYAVTKQLYTSQAVTVYSFLKILQTAFLRIFTAVIA